MADTILNLKIGINVEDVKAVDALLSSIIEKQGKIGKDIVTVNFGDKGIKGGYQPNINNARLPPSINLPYASPASSSNMTRSSSDARIIEVRNDTRALTSEIASLNQNIKQVYVDKKHPSLDTARVAAITQSRPQTQVGLGNALFSSATSATSEKALKDMLEQHRKVQDAINQDSRKVIERLKEYTKFRSEAMPITSAMPALLANLTTLQTTLERETKALHSRRVPSYRAVPINQVEIDNSIKIGRSPTASSPITQIKARQTEQAIAKSISRLEDIFTEAFTRGKISGQDILSRDITEKLNKGFKVLSKSLDEIAEKANQGDLQGAAGQFGRAKLQRVSTPTGDFGGMEFRTLNVEQLRKIAARHLQDVKTVQTDTEVATVLGQLKAKLKSGFQRELETALVSFQIPTLAASDRGMQLVHAGQKGTIRSNPIEFVELRTGIDRFVEAVRKMTPNETPALALKTVRRPDEIKATVLQGKVLEPEFDALFRKLNSGQYGFKEGEITTAIQRAISYRVGQAKAQEFVQDNVYNARIRKIQPGLPIKQRVEEEKLARSFAIRASRGEIQAGDISAITRQQEAEARKAAHTVYANLKESNKGLDDLLVMARDVGISGTAILRHLTVAKRQGITDRVIDALTSSDGKSPARGVSISTPLGSSLVNLVEMRGRPQNIERARSTFSRPINTVLEDVEPFDDQIISSPFNPVAEMRKARLRRANINKRALQQVSIAVSPSIGNINASGLRNPKGLFERSFSIQTEIEDVLRDVNDVLAFGAPNEDLEGLRGVSGRSLSEEVAAKIKEGIPGGMLGVKRVRGSIRDIIPYARPTVLTRRSEQALSGIGPHLPFLRTVEGQEAIDAGIIGPAAYNTVTEFRTTPSTFEDQMLLRRNSKLGKSVTGGIRNLIREISENFVDKNKNIISRETALSSIYETGDFITSNLGLPSFSMNKKGGAAQVLSVIEKGIKEGTTSTDALVVQLLELFGSQSGKKISLPSGAKGVVRLVDDNFLGEQILPKTAYKSLDYLLRKKKLSVDPVSDDLKTARRGAARFGNFLYWDEADIREAGLAIPSNGTKAKGLNTEELIEEIQKTKKAINAVFGEDIKSISDFRRKVKEIAGDDEKALYTKRHIDLVTSEASIARRGLRPEIASAVATAFTGEVPLVVGNESPELLNILMHKYGVGIGFGSQNGNLPILTKAVGGEERAEGVHPSLTAKIPITEFAALRPQGGVESEKFLKFNPNTLAGFKTSFGETSEVFRELMKASEGASLRFYELLKVMVSMDAELASTSPHLQKYRDTVLQHATLVTPSEFTKLGEESFSSRSSLEGSVHDTRRFPGTLKIPIPDALRTTRPNLPEYLVVPGAAARGTFLTESGNVGQDKLGRSITDTVRSLQEYTSGASIPKLALSKGIYRYTAALKERIDNLQDDEDEAQKISDEMDRVAGEAIGGRDTVALRTIQEQVITPGMPSGVARQKVLMQKASALSNAMLHGYRANDPHEGGALGRPSILDAIYGGGSEDRLSWDTEYARLADVFSGSSSRLGFHGIGFRQGEETNPEVADQVAFSIQGLMDSLNEQVFGKGSIFHTGTSELRYPTVMLPITNKPANIEPQLKNIKELSSAIGSADISDFDVMEKHVVALAEELKKAQTSSIDTIEIHEDRLKELLDNMVKSGYTDRGTADRLIEQASREGIGSFATRFPITDFKSFQGKILKTHKDDDRQFTTTIAGGLSAESQAAAFDSNLIQFDKNRTPVGGKLVEVKKELERQRNVLLAKPIGDLTDADKEKLGNLSLRYTALSKAILSLTNTFHAMTMAADFDGDKFFVSLMAGTEAQKELVRSVQKLSKGYEMVNGRPVIISDFQSELQDAQMAGKGPKIREGEGKKGTIGRAEDIISNIDSLFKSEQLPGFFTKLSVGKDKDGNKIDVGAPKYGTLASLRGPEAIVAVADAFKTYISEFGGDRNAPDKYGQEGKMAEGEISLRRVLAESGVALSSRPLVIGNTSSPETQANIDAAARSAVDQLETKSTIIKLAGPKILTGAVTESANTVVRLLEAEHKKALTRITTKYGLQTGGEGHEALLAELSTKEGSFQHSSAGIIQEALSTKFGKLPEALKLLNALNAPTSSSFSEGEMSYEDFIETIGEGKGFQSLNRPVQEARDARIRSLSNLDPDTLMQRLLAYARIKEEVRPGSRTIFSGVETQYTAADIAREIEKHKAGQDSVFKSGGVSSQKIIDTLSRDYGPREVVQLMRDILTRNTVSAVSTKMQDREWQLRVGGESETSARATILAEIAKTFGFLKNLRPDVTGMTEAITTATSGKVFDLNTAPIHDIVAAVTNIKGPRVFQTVAPIRQFANKGINRLREMLGFKGGAEEEAELSKLTGGVTSQFLQSLIRATNPEMSTADVEAVQRSQKNAVEYLSKYNEKLSSLDARLKKREYKRNRVYATLDSGGELLVDDTEPAKQLDTDIGVMFDRIQVPSTSNLRSLSNPTFSARDAFLRAVRGSSVAASIKEDTEKRFNISNTDLLNLDRLPTEGQESFQEEPEVIKAFEEFQKAFQRDPNRRLAREKEKLKVLLEAKKRQSEGELGDIVPSPALDRDIERSKIRIGAIQDKVRREKLLELERYGASNEGTIALLNLMAGSSGKVDIEAAVKARGAVGIKPPIESGSSGNFGTPSVTGMMNDSQFKELMRLQAQMIEILRESAITLKRLVAISSSPPDKRPGYVGKEGSTLAKFSGFNEASAAELAAAGVVAESPETQEFFARLAGAGSGELRLSPSGLGNLRKKNEAGTLSLSDFMGSRDFLGIPNEEIPDAIMKALKEPASDSVVLGTALDAAYSSFSSVLVEDAHKINEARERGLRTLEETITREYPGNIKDAGPLKSMAREIFDKMSESTANRTLAEQTIGSQVRLATRGRVSGVDYRLGGTADIITAGSTQYGAGANIPHLGIVDIKTNKQYEGDIDAEAILNDKDNKFRTQLLSYALPFFQLKKALKGKSPEEKNAIVKKKIASMHPGHNASEDVKKLFNPAALEAVIGEYVRGERELAVGIAPLDAPAQMVVMSDERLEEFQTQLEKEVPEFAEFIRTSTKKLLERDSSKVGIRRQRMRQSGPRSFYRRVGDRARFGFNIPALTPEGMEFLAHTGVSSSNPESDRAQRKLNSEKVLYSFIKEASSVDNPEDLLFTHENENVYGQYNPVTGKPQLNTRAFPSFAEAIRNRQFLKEGSLDTEAVAGFISGMGRDDRLKLLATLTHESGHVALAPAFSGGYGANNYGTAKLDEILDSKDSSIAKLLAEQARATIKVGAVSSSIQESLGYGTDASGKEAMNAALSSGIDEFMAEGKTTLAGATASEEAIATAFKRVLFTALEELLAGVITRVTTGLGAPNLGVLGSSAPIAAVETLQKEALRATSLVGRAPGNKLFTVGSNTARRTATNLVATSFMDDPEAVRRYATGNRGGDDESSDFIYDDDFGHIPGGRSTVSPEEAAARHGAVPIDRPNRINHEEELKGILEDPYIAKLEASQSRFKARHAVKHAPLFELEDSGRGTELFKLLSGKKAGLRITESNARKLEEALEDFYSKARDYRAGRGTDANAVRRALESAKHIGDTVARAGVARAGGKKDILSTTDLTAFWKEFENLLYEGHTSQLRGHRIEAEDLLKAEDKNSPEWVRRVDELRERHRISKNYLNKIMARSSMKKDPHFPYTISEMEGYDKDIDTLPGFEEARDLERRNRLANLPEGAIPREATFRALGDEARSRPVSSRLNDILSLLMQPEHMGNFSTNLTNTIATMEASAQTSLGPKSEKELRDYKLLLGTLRKVSAGAERAQGLGGAMVMEPEHAKFVAERMFQEAKIKKERNPQFSLERYVYGKDYEGPRLTEERLTEMFTSIPDEMPHESIASLSPGLQARFHRENQAILRRRVYAADVLRKERPEIYAQYADTLHTFEPGTSIGQTQKITDTSGRIIATRKAIIRPGGSDRDLSFRDINEKIENNAPSSNQTLSNAFKRVALWGTASGVVYGLIRAIGNMAQVIKQTEVNMIELKKVMNPATTDFAKLRDNAVGFAKEFGTSVNSVLDSFVVFAKQGLGQADVLERGRTSVLAGNVTEGMKPEKATEIFTSALKQFPEEGGDSLRFLDSLNEVANRFAVTEIDLGDALLRAGASAKVAGVSFDEFLGLTTSLVEVTRKTGREVGTSLNFILRSLYRPKSKQALAEVGIPIVDAKGLRSATDILKDLSTKFDSLSAEQKLNVVEATVGTRRYNDFAVILQNFDTALSASAISANSQGSALRENQLVMESFAKKTEVLKASTDALAIQFGDILLPVLKGTVDTMSGLVQIFTEIPSSVKLAVTSAAALLIVLGKIQEIKWMTGDLAGGASFGKLFSSITTGITEGWAKFIPSLLSNTKVLGATLAGLALLFTDIGSAAAKTFSNIKDDLGSLFGSKLTGEGIEKKLSTSIFKDEDISTRAALASSRLAKVGQAFIKSYNIEKSGPEGNSEALSKISEGTFESPIAIRKKALIEQQTITNDIARLNLDLVHHYDSQGNAILKSNNLLSIQLDLVKSISDTAIAFSKIKIAEGFASELGNLQKSTDLRRQQLKDFLPNLGPAGEYIADKLASKPVIQLKSYTERINKLLERRNRGDNSGDEELRDLTTKSAEAQASIDTIVSRFYENFNPASKTLAPSEVLSKLNTEANKNALLEISKRELAKGGELNVPIIKQDELIRQRTQENAAALVFSQFGIPTRGTSSGRGLAEKYMAAGLTPKGILTGEATPANKDVVTFSDEIANQLGLAAKFAVFIGDSFHSLGADNTIKDFTVNALNNAVASVADTAEARFTMMFSNVAQDTETLFEAAVKEARRIPTGAGFGISFPGDINTGARLEKELEPQLRLYRKFGSSLINIGGEEAGGKQENFLDIVRKQQETLKTRKEALGLTKDSGRTSQFDSEEVDNLVKISDSSRKAVKDLQEILANNSAIVTFSQEIQNLGDVITSVADSIRERRELLQFKSLDERNYLTGARGRQTPDLGTRRVNLSPFERQVQGGGGISKLVDDFNETKALVNDVSSVGQNAVKSKLLVQNIIRDFTKAGISPDTKSLEEVGAAAKSGTLAQYEDKELQLQSISVSKDIFVESERSNQLLEIIAESSVKGFAEKDKTATLKALQGKLPNTFKGVDEAVNKGDFGALSTIISNIFTSGGISTKNKIAIRDAIIERAGKVGVASTESMPLETTRGNAMSMALREQLANLASLTPGEDTTVDPTKYRENLGAFQQLTLNILDEWISASRERGNELASVGDRLSTVLDGLKATIDGVLGAIEGGFNSILTNFNQLSTAVAAPSIGIGELTGFKNVNPSLDLRRRKEDLSPEERLFSSRQEDVFSVNILNSALQESGNMISGLKDKLVQFSREGRSQEEKNILFSSIRDIESAREDMTDQLKLLADSFSRGLDIQKIVSSLESLRRQFDIFDLDKKNPYNKTSLQTALELQPRQLLDGSNGQKYFGSSGLTGSQQEIERGQKKHSSIIDDRNASLAKEAADEARRLKENQDKLAKEQSLGEEARNIALEGIRLKVPGSQQLLDDINFALSGAGSIVGEKGHVPEFAGVKIDEVLDRGIKNLSVELEKTKANISAEAIAKNLGGTFNELFGNFILAEDKLFQRSDTVATANTENIVYWLQQIAANGNARIAAGVGSGPFVGGASVTPGDVGAPAVVGGITKGGYSIASAGATGSYVGPSGYQIATGGGQQVEGTLVSSNFVTPASLSGPLPSTPASSRIAASPATNSTFGLSYLSSLPNFSSGQDVSDARLTNDILRASPFFGATVLNRLGLANEGGKAVSGTVKLAGEGIGGWLESSPSVLGAEADAEVKAAEKIGLFRRGAKRLSSGSKFTWEALTGKIPGGTFNKAVTVAAPILGAAEMYGDFKTSRAEENNLTMSAYDATFGRRRATDTNSTFQNVTNFASNALRPSSTGMAIGGLVAVLGTIAAALSAPITVPAATAVVGTGALIGGGIGLVKEGYEASTASSTHQSPLRDAFESITSPDTYYFKQVNLRRKAIDEELRTINESIAAGDDGNELQKRRNELLAKKAAAETIVSQYDNYSKGKGDSLEMYNKINAAQNILGFSSGGSSPSFFSYNDFNKNFKNRGEDYKSSSPAPIDWIVKAGNKELYYQFKKELDKIVKDRESKGPLSTKEIESARDAALAATTENDNSILNIGIPFSSQAQSRMEFIRQFTRNKGTIANYPSNPDAIASLFSSSPTGVPTPAFSAVAGGISPEVEKALDTERTKGASFGDAAVTLGELTIALEDFRKVMADSGLTLDDLTKRGGDFRLKAALIANTFSDLSQNGAEASTKISSISAASSIRVLQRGVQGEAVGADIKTVTRLIEAMKSISSDENLKSIVSDREIAQDRANKILTGAASSIIDDKSGLSLVASKGTVVKSGNTISQEGNSYSGRGGGIDALKGLYSSEGFSPDQVQNKLSTFFDDLVRELQSQGVNKDIIESLIPEMSFSQIAESIKGDKGIGEAFFNQQNANLVTGNRNVNSPFQSMLLAIDRASSASLNLAGGKEGMPWVITGSPRPRHYGMSDISRREPTIGYISQMNDKYSLPETSIFHKDIDKEMALRQQAVFDKLAEDSNSPFHGMTMIGGQLVAQVPSIKGVRRNNAFRPSISALVSDLNKSGSSILASSSYPDIIGSTLRKAGVIGAFAADTTGKTKDAYSQNIDTAKTFGLDRIFEQLGGSFRYSGGQQKAYLGNKEISSEAFASWGEKSLKDNPIAQLLGVNFKRDDSKGKDAGEKIDKKVETKGAPELVVSKIIVQGEITTPSIKAGDLSIKGNESKKGSSVSAAGVNEVTISYITEMVLNRMDVPGIQKKVEKSLEVATSASSAASVATSQINTVNETAKAANLTAGRALTVAENAKNIASKVNERCSPS